MNTLPISRLINVSVSLTAIPAQSQSLSTLLLLADDAEIDVVERMREYSDITEVADQFGTVSPIYLAALLWFQQAPQPTSLLIGRWADAASAGVLVGGTLTTPNQAIASWTGIADGSFSINVDGAGVANITGLDFTLAANLNAVAAIIDAAIAAEGADCVFDANFQRFLITSQTTGIASTVSFLGLAGSGTDISAQMAGTAATNAYQAAGIAAETPVAAAAIFDDRFGQQWYAVHFIGASDAELIAVSGFVEATDTKHFHAISSQDNAILSAVATTDIAFALKALGYKKTAVQYSSSSPYSAMSLMGRILTTDYDGNNTVITLMYKDEPGIVAEELTTSEINALEGKNANVFAAYNNDTAIIEPGVTPSGEFIDTILGADWLAVTIMTALYNLMTSTPTKIPQTDAGVHMLTTTIDQVCSQGVANGYLAPGVWNSSGFGTLKQGQFLEKGWYTYATPLAQQSQAGRAARVAPPIQVAAKLAGAIHTVDVAVTVNQ